MCKPYYYGSHKEVKVENITQDVKHTRLAAEATLNKFLAFAQQHNAALAIYKMPNDLKLQIICDLSGGKYVEELNLEDLTSGFLLHPFQVATDKIVHFEAEILAEIALDTTHDIQENCSPLQWKKTINTAVENQILHTESSFDFSQLTKNKNSPSTTVVDYIAMVKKGIRYIKDEHFYKVVPSKVKKIESKNDLNLGQAFINACQKYPTAFVNLTFSAKTGLWFGATPETLIEDRKGEYFKTMALAATQAKSEKSISETSWTQKEIEEQAYVSRFVINCFKKIRLREFEEIGPKTVQAGNLLHLKTSFKVNTELENFPELGSVMLNLLHPTSAVCGMPKESSFDFLIREEKHNRSYYSGFLGPIHLDGLSHLFVHLRCCQINNQSVTFYAGAGITEDSIAEKEWEETDLKCNILSDVIFGKQS